MTHSIVRATPRYMSKVWGGAKLLAHPHARIAPPQRPHLRPDDPIGEAWQVADLTDGESFVEAVGLSGHESDGAVITLGALRQAEGARWTGRAEGERYPLLIKTLDARHDLSIQVHPGPEHLHRLSHAQSKDECWLILDADPGSSVLHGLLPGVTRADLERALTQRADVAALLRRHEVRVGDVIHVPPGTVHAICGGVTLLEIQEPSDTTYRVWDYERPGLDGVLRPLHIEQALSVMCFDAQPPLLTLAHELNAQRALLVDAPNYRVERLTLDTRDATLTLTPADARAARALYILGGAITAHASDDAGLELTSGDVALIATDVARLTLRARSQRGAQVILASA